MYYDDEYYRMQEAWQAKMDEWDEERKEQICEETYEREERKKRDDFLLFDDEPVGEGFDFLSFIVSGPVQMMIGISMVHVLLFVLSVKLVIFLVKCIICVVRKIIKAIRRRRKSKASRKRQSFFSREK